MGGRGKEHGEGRRREGRLERLEDVKIVKGKESNVEWGW